MIDNDGGGLRKRTRRYTNTPSTTIEDPDISLKALGLLIFSLNKPDGWVFRADAIARERNCDGRDAIASGYKELAKRGYYRVERRRLLDGTFKMGNAISEEPVPEWAREYEEYGGKPIPLVQQRDGTFKVRRQDGSLTGDGFEGEFAQVGPVPGFPEPGEPGPGNPGSGPPESGTTGPGNPVPLTTKENPLQKPTTETPPGGGGDASRLHPSGGARAARATAPEPSGDAGTDPLFEVDGGDPAGNDLARTGQVPAPRRGGAQPRKAQAPRASVFRDDWWPDEVTWQRARKECPLLDDARLRLEVQQAISYSQARGKPYKDHNKMWLNWVRRENQYAADRARQRQVSGGGVYRNDEHWNTGPVAESWEDVNTLPVDTEGEAPSLEEVIEATRRETEELDRRRREAGARRRNPWAQ